MNVRQTERLRGAPVTAAILWANIGTFALQFFVDSHFGRQGGSIRADTNRLLGSNYGLATFRENRFETLITYAFLHAGVVHIALNMLALFVVGPVVERRWGSARIAPLYLASAVVAGLVSASAALFSHAEYGSVGASGAISGVIAAAMTMSWRYDGFRAPLTQLMGRWLLFTLLFGFAMSFMGGGIDNGAHAGGAAAGVVFGLLWKRGYVYSSRAKLLVYSGCIACVIASVSVLAYRDLTDPYAPLSARMRLELAADALRVGQCEEARRALLAFERLMPNDAQIQPFRDEIDRECIR